MIEDCFATHARVVPRSRCPASRAPTRCGAIGADVRGFDRERSRRCSRASSSRTRHPVEDDDIRAATARGFGRLVDYVETVSGADRVTVARFFAKGMLMNVLAAMHYSISGRATRLLGRALAEGAGRTTHEGSSLFLQQVSNQSLDRYQTDTGRSR